MIPMSSSDEPEYGSPSHPEAAGLTPKAGIKLRLPASKPKKALRTAKPKPLRDVLNRLIATIKKKDQYGFFLHPVDADNIPGYSAIVAHPMDFGTITAKIHRGYRALEDFKSDVLLVTQNSKSFNGPGSPYHIAAVKVEAWALDQIAKAEGTVFEPAEDELAMAVDHNEQAPVEAEGSSMDTSARESSVVQSARRPHGTRGPYKKTVIAAEAKDVMDNTGRLPGYKQGIGSFPATSGLAEAMVRLKIRGKRYKTKKERMRVEKEGLPSCADGSLNIGEMEDPFTVMSALVPDPYPSIPYLVSLYPTQSTLQAPSSLLFSARPTEVVPSPPTPPGFTRPRRRHWVISRVQAARRAEEPPATVELIPRAPLPTDYGPYSTLIGQLEEEMRVRGARSVADQRRVIDTEEGLLNIIQWTLNSPASIHTSNASASEAHSSTAAASFIHNVVYGGTKGLAYVRSITEFVGGMSASRPAGASYPLGVPLPTYVQRSIIDPLTPGQYTLARQNEAARLHRARLSLDGSLQAIFREPVDLAALVYVAEDLTSHSELEWAGKAYKASPGYLSSEAYKWRTALRATLQEPVPEGLDVWDYAIQHSTGLLAELDRKVRTGPLTENELRELRMNLCALAKRAPVDCIV